METQLVVFDLAQEQYGVDIGAVQGILKLPVIPHAPASVQAVTNLRGQVRPILYLRTM